MADEKMREGLAHLVEVTAHPEIPLNADLLKSLSTRIDTASYFYESDMALLLNQLSALLPTLHQDPSPIAALVASLTESAYLTFDRVLAIKPAIDFANGLASPSSSINLITLGLLDKARNERSASEIVAGKHEVVATLVRLWLTTQDTDVAEKANTVLVDLLFAHELSEKGFVQGEPFYLGLMWRRVFRDKDIYGSILSLCSLTTTGAEGQLNKKEKTVAQGRLLDFLLKVDCEPLRTSQFPDIEVLYGVRGGLLDFAALHMVDYEDDILMHMNLIKFYREFLVSNFHSERGLESVNEYSPHSSKALDFLVDTGLHARMISGYLPHGTEVESALTSALLYNDCADYISVYCMKYQTHLLQTSSSLIDKILDHLNTVIAQTSGSYWAHSQAPIYDLRVLVSLPRVALIPKGDYDSPLFEVAESPGNSIAFSALTTAFYGGEPIVLHGGKASLEIRPDERAASRALYFLCLQNCDIDFWSLVVNAAESVALKDVAVAAIDVVKAVICAQWEPLPTTRSEGDTDQSYHLPTESELVQRCYSLHSSLLTSPEQLPPTGILAILTPPARSVVIPYLLRPCRRYHTAQGPGRYDNECYTVAHRKSEILEVMHRKLKELATLEDGTVERVSDRGFGRPLISELTKAVERRLAEGIFGASDVGGTVATLDL